MHGSLFVLALTSVVIIDRIEGAYAVVEAPDGSFHDVPLVMLPSDVHEGDALSLRISGNTRSAGAHARAGRPRGAVAPHRGRPAQPGDPSPFGGQP
jgi:hypothetical protein